VRAAIFDLRPLFLSWGRSAFFIRVHATRPCGKRGSTPRLPKIEIRQPSGRIKEALAQEKERTFMPLIQLLEVLIVVGVLLWLVNRFIPMQSSIKSILNGVVVIAVVLWLLNVFGLFHSLSRVRIGS
jgi:hypothetical protein